MSSPNVVILLPSGMTTVHVFDTLIVQVQVRDDKELVWVRFQIYNSNNITVVPTITRQIGSSLNEEITLGIPIEDIHLESGEYYLRVTAFDGTNESSSFRELFIVEAPLELLKVFLFSQPNPGTISIDSLSQNEVFNAAVLNSDFREAAINSYDQEIILSGETEDGMTFLSGVDLVPIATTNNPTNDGNPFFLDLFHHENFRRTYISRRDGMVHVFGQMGVLKQSIIVSPNLRPHMCFADEEYVYILLKNFAETQNSLAIHYRGSGIFFQSLALESDIVAMATFDDGLLLFNAGDNTASLYRAQGNFIDYTLNLNLSGDLLDVEHIPETNGFVLATENDVYYNYDLLQGAPVSLGISDAVDVEYEVISGSLYTLSQAQLWITDLQGNVVNSIAIPQSAKQVLLLYNK